MIAHRFSLFGGIPAFFRGIKNIFRWWKFLKQDQNYHYGFLLRTIVYKLEIMSNNWDKNYYKSNVQVESINNLIRNGKELIVLLTKEEEFGHIRSDRYKKKNDEFFNKLKELNVDIYQ